MTEIAGVAAEAWQAKMAAFLEHEGRRPRLLLAMSAASGRALASALADLGVDVDLSPPHRGPSDRALAKTARQAVENDVHGVVIEDDAPALARALAALGGEEIRAAALQGRTGAEALALALSLLEGLGA